MLVFHGSTIEIKQPVVALGRERLDFGKGFYMTDIKPQAELWALRMERIRNTPGIVNIYDLDMDGIKKEYSYYHFERYDLEWLQFIIANRTGSGWADHYDLIEGGVANDRVIDTVEAYMSNMMPLENALTELSKHQPNNQLCITNQTVIDKYLSFIKSYKLEDNNVK